MEMYSNKNETIKRKPIGKMNGKVNAIFDRAGHKWADWMSKRASGMAPGAVYALFFIFIAFSIVYNVFVLTGYVSTNRMDYGQIKVPVDISYPSNLEDEFAVQQELKKVIAFRKHMDSLATSNEGRHIYDSIMLARPGLLDSARVLESLLSNPLK